MRMKVILVSAAACIVILAFSLACEAETTDPTLLIRIDEATDLPKLDDGETINIVPEDDRPHKKLLRMLTWPVQATYDGARRIFGSLPFGLPSTLGGVADSADKIRMKTFQIFMSLYNKTYSPEEMPRRMALFFARRQDIEESVKLFQQGKALFAMRENAFIDWDDDELKKLTGVSLPRRDEMTPEELEAISEGVVSVTSPTRITKIDDDSTTEDDDEIYNREFNDYKLLNQDENPAASPNDTLEDDVNLNVGLQIPATVDWRESGCVATPIDQMKCGACYAIATMNTVETMRCLKTDKSPQLSSQQIVDCSVSYNNFGCDGGWPTRVLKYLQDHKIVARESCYPFVRQQHSSCRLPSVRSKSGCTVSASPTNSARLEYKVLNNERDIMYHVATTGPVITVMKASSKFLYYGTGIFDDPRCSRRRDDVDHAITIVGYGKQNGVDYWIIKNSWGSDSWGIKGYGLYKRGTNACSIGHWGWVVTK